MNETTVDGQTIQLISRLSFKFLDNIKQCEMVSLIDFENEDKIQLNVRRIQRRAKYTLSRPARYIFLQFLVRLTHYIKTHIDNDGERVLIPKPKNDFDATLLDIWRKWRLWTQLWTQKQMVKDEYSTYSDLYEGIIVLVYAIGEEFNVVAEYD